MIKIYNKHKEEHQGDNVFYIGRNGGDKPSILGNPYTHIKDRTTKAKFIVSSREEAIFSYSKYMREQYKQDENFKVIIDKILELDLLGETVYLGCWCKPKSCHGDLILEFIQELKLKFLLNKRNKNG